MKVNSKTKYYKTKIVVLCHLSSTGSRVEHFVMESVLNSSFYFNGIVMYLYRKENAKKKCRKPENEKFKWYCFNKRYYNNGSAVVVVIIVMMIISVIFHRCIK